MGTGQELRVINHALFRRIITSGFSWAPPGERLAYAGRVGWEILCP